ncbi:MAG: hypothetical protein KatS3mg010_0046 [Acidimicrobiia bacterium]|nr:MAG: hypothetical protein KatS3mg010_0046 [Acidimicrobiia bacterium]
MLRIFDTAARAKVDFVPRVEGAVSMYVCGPTPYSEPHLGHGRKEVVFDTVRRYLMWRGYRVSYVSNVTDIEDRIIARAQEEGTTVPELVARFEREFRDAFDRLNVLPPDEEPHATEWIGPMIELIEALLARGHAYVVEGQGVYFRVSYAPRVRRALAPRWRSCSRRGRASRSTSASERRSTSRCGRRPSPASRAWESPWGPGRPGWHIECSAMSLAILGDGFDIHGGGDDLVFPHHENEIAQASSGAGPSPRTGCTTGC